MHLLLCSILAAQYTVYTYRFQVTDDVCTFDVCLCLGGATNLCLPGVCGGVFSGSFVSLYRSPGDQKQNLCGHQPELRKEKQDL